MGRKTSNSAPADTLQIIDKLQFLSFILVTFGPVTPEFTLLTMTPFEIFLLKVSTFTLEI